MNYAEIREKLTRDHPGKFKFERWIVEEEIQIISEAIKGYPVCYESGTANGLSSYCFSKVITGPIHTFDPFNRYKIWDYLTLDYSKIIYHEASFVDIAKLLPKMSIEPKAFFIDGGHAYDEVRADWLAIKPFLKPDDVIIFHDTLGIKGVNRFLKEVTSEITVYSKLLSDNPRRGITEIRV